MNGTKRKVKKRTQHTHKGISRISSGCMPKHEHLILILAQIIDYFKLLFVSHFIVYLYEGMARRELPTLGTWSWLCGVQRHSKGCRQNEQRRPFKGNKEIHNS